jgi:putative ABC transport system ATP-binding protein
MVTHDLEAAALGDRVIVLRDGGVHRELTAPTAEQVLEAVALAGAHR